MNKLFETILRSFERYMKCVCCFWSTQQLADMRGPELDQTALTSMRSLRPNGFPQLKCKALIAIITPPFPSIICPKLSQRIVASLCFALLTQLLAWSGKCTFQCSIKCTNHCKIWWTAEACRVLRRDFRWVTSVLPKRMNCCFRLFRLSNMLT